MIQRDVIDTGGTIVRWWCTVHRPNRFPSEIDYPRSMKLVCACQDVEAFRQVIFAQQVNNSRDKGSDPLRSVAIGADYDHSNR